MTRPNSCKVDALRQQQHCVASETQEKARSIQAHSLEDLLPKLEEHTAEICPAHQVVVYPHLQVRKA